jgi:hypothetical protein
LPDGGAYLTADEALGVCSKIWVCPLLRGSIQFSLAVFTGYVSALGNTDSFSLCMQWLAGPIPSDRVGYADQQRRLACIAQAATCAQALDCLPFAFNPPECANADAGTWCADGGLLYRCGSFSLEAHCGDSYFGPNATCDPLLHACVTSASCVGVKCQGSQQIACLTSTQITTSDCALAGMACESTTCGAPGVPPSGNFPAVDCWNDGGTVIVSARGSQTQGPLYSPFNCAAFGATCRKDGDAGVNAYCALPGETCDLFGPKPTTCLDATHIQTCFAGSTTVFDCASIRDGGACFTAGAPHCTAPWP